MFAHTLSLAVLALASGPAAAETVTPPPGTLVFHPLSANTQERVQGVYVSQHAPDVDAELVSYVLPVLDEAPAEAASCGVTIRWTGGEQVVRTEGCANPFYDAAHAAAKAWTWELRGGDPSDTYTVDTTLAWRAGEAVGHGVFVAEGAEEATFGEATPGLSGRRSLVPRRRVSPRFPLEAYDLHPTATCMALIYLDTRGRPEEVSVSRCPQVFHQPTIRALRRWRFEVPEVDGEPVESRFSLRIRYVQEPPR